MSQPVTAGIDASKAHLDVAARPGTRFRVANNPDGLAELVRRRQLLGMRVAEGNRLRPGLPAAVREGIEAHLGWLDEQVAAIDKEVGAAVRRTPGVAGEGPAPAVHPGGRAGGQPDPPGRP